MHPFGNIPRSQGYQAWPESSGKGSRAKLKKMRMRFATLSNIVVNTITKYSLLGMFCIKYAIIHIQVTIFKSLSYFLSTIACAARKF